MRPTAISVPRSRPKQIFLELPKNWQPWRVRSGLVLMRAGPIFANGNKNPSIPQCGLPIQKRLHQPPQERVFFDQPPQQRAFPPHPSYGAKDKVVEIDVEAGRRFSPGDDANDPGAHQDRVADVDLAGHVSCHVQSRDGRLVGPAMIDRTSIGAISAPICRSRHSSGSAPRSAKIWLHLTASGSA